ncbi:MAG TPA: hypothetical protein VG474_13000, partial [Solirubrobacteraceae bacterium]|nr:hypothetical protein [Solirubrobacteraceae bacterium]
MSRLGNLAVLVRSRARAAGRVDADDASATSARRAALRVGGRLAPLLVLVVALLLGGALGGPVIGAAAEPRQCSDGIDNDLDGKTDFPADPGCRNRQDNNETDPAPPPPPPPPAPPPPP